MYGLFSPSFNQQSGLLGQLMYLADMPQQYNWQQSFRPTGLLGGSYLSMGTGQNQGPQQPQIGFGGDNMLRSKY